MGTVAQVKKKVCYPIKHQVCYDRTCCRYCCFVMMKKPKTDMLSHCWNKVFWKTASLSSAH